MADPTLFPLEPYIVIEELAVTVREGYLMAYRGNTRKGYSTDLRLWFRWCEERAIPIMEAKRVHVETYMREMEDAGLKDGTRQRRLVSIAGFYRYAEQEDIILKSPAKYVRRPQVPNESTSNYLDRYELGAFLTHAETMGPHPGALCCLLSLNGLRVSEVCGADVDGVNIIKGHKTLLVTRKGGKEAEIPMAPRTFRNVVQAIGSRDDGPLLLNSLGERMTRHTAARIVRRVAHRAGIQKKIGPHACRHTFVSLGLDAGVPLRDMQTAAGHRNVSTTTRYDRRDRNLDSHATYVVSALIGAA